MHTQKKKKQTTYKTSSAIVALSSISKISPVFSRATPKLLTKNQKDLTLAGLMNRLPHSEAQFSHQFHLICCAKAVATTRPAEADKVSSPC